MVLLFVLIWYKIGIDMNTVQTTQEQIKISVSRELKSLVKSRAQNIGIPVTQYVKNLIINDVKGYPTYQVDEETERRIGQSLKDVEEGRYTILKSDEDIENHFNNLHK